MASERMISEHGESTAHDKLANMIMMHGWAVVSVTAGKDTPKFSYTVGLGGKGFPELIMFGINKKVAYLILNNLAQRVVDGLVLHTGELLTDVAATSMAAVELSEADAKENLHAAAAFTDDFRAFQVVWPDQNAIFPWERGYDRDWLAIQPIIQPMKRQLQ